MDVSSFGSIAEYLSDPLVLTGFTLFLFFGFSRAILNSGLLRQINQGQSYDIIKRLLFFGFIAAIALMLLAFGLKYREMAKTEQIKSVKAICTELVENRKTSGELAANLGSILTNTKVVAEALRKDDDGILREMFPWKNIDPDDDTPSALIMARQRLEYVGASGLLNDETKRQLFDLSARAISSTIVRTRTAMTSMADLEGKRFLISRDAWKANQHVIRKIDIQDLSGLESTYGAFEKSRREYNTVMGYAMSYLDGISELLDPKDNTIDEPKLSVALASERQFFAVATAYAASLTSHIDAARQTIGDLGCS